MTAHTRPKFVSQHGRRFGLAPGYLVVDDNQVGPPLSVAISATGNSATTSEVTLKSYTLKANELVLANQGIYVKAFGTFAGNAQNKRATLYVGGVNVTTASVTDSGATWLLEARYYKTGASTQRALTGGQHGSTLLSLADTTDTAVDTSDITISLKATSGSGSASDIVCDGLEVGFI
jgi:hypothetical protein